MAGDPQPPRPRRAGKRDVFRGSRLRRQAPLFGFDPEIFDHIPDGVCIVGPDHAVRHVNIALARMLKRPIPEIIGKTHGELFGHLVEDDADCPVARMEASHHRESGQVRIGPRWYDVLANPIFDSRGRAAGAIHIFSDVTSLQNAEESLLRLNRVLTVLYLSGQVLVRAVQESALLEEICRIVVGKGGFARAWIGLVAPNGRGGVREIARVGAGGDDHDDELEGLRDAAREALAKGRPMVLNTIGGGRSGQASWLILPMIMKGQPLGLMAVCADEPDAFPERDVMMLTELAGDLAFGVEAIRTRERHESAVLDLRASEEKYANLIESGHDGIVVARDGRLVYANSRAVEMAKRPLAELIGLKVPDLVVPEHAAMVAETHRARLAGEAAPSSYEIDLLTGDGGRLPVELSSSAIDFDGGPATMSFVRDVSARRAAEGRLRESEERYRTTLDGMLEGCQILGHDWRYLYVNEAVCGHAKKRRDELIGRRITEVYPGIEATPLFAQLQACMNDRAAARMENEFEYPDGSRGWFELSIQPVPEGIFIISLDVSERKKKDLEIAESGRRLREAYLRLRDVQDGTIGAIATMAELRDPYTSGHQRRVARVACAIAEEMGLSEDRIAGLATAGLLHDIGKIQVPSDILSKPGRLSPVELEMIKSHSQAGHQILHAIPFPWPVADIIVQHHERLDGSGYPAGLAGDKILLEARILGVADVLEAMASHRPYRAALGVKAALEELVRNGGRLYDPEVVAAAVRVFDRGFDLDKAAD